MEIDFGGMEDDQLIGSLDRRREESCVRSIREVLGGFSIGRSYPKNLPTSSSSSVRGHSAGRLASSRCP
jgi:hypothetical protein